MFREVKRLKMLAHDNAKLKRLLADAMLDVTALKDLLAKNIRVAVKQEAVAHLLTRFEMSERQATNLVGADRTMIALQRAMAGRPALRARLRDLAHERHRFG